MRQLLVKRIIKHIEENRILNEKVDYEEMEPAYYDEMKALKPYIKEADWTAFMVNMAIMYVNQGLLYARCKLSEKEFDNYAIWFSIDMDEDTKEFQHYYDCHPCYTRKAGYMLYYMTKRPVDIERISIYDMIKDVNGLSDFYCFEGYGYTPDDIIYEFIPKSIVDRYKASLKK